MADIASQAPICYLRDERFTRGTRSLLPVFAGGCSPAELGGAGKHPTSGRPQEGAAQSGGVFHGAPFRGPLGRGRRGSGKQRGEPLSQPSAFLPSVPASPLPTRRSGRQRPHVQSRGESPRPLRRALIQASGCPPNRNQTKRSRGGCSDVAPWLLFVRVYKQSFFLLCYLLFSRLRNIAQDLIWVSLFKCPNPCKGLVSGCVHFAQY